MIRTRRLQPLLPFLALGLLALTNPCPRTAQAAAGQPGVSDSPVRWQHDRLLRPSHLLSSAIYDFDVQFNLIKLRGLRRSNRAVFVLVC